MEKPKPLSTSAQFVVTTRTWSLSACHFFFFFFAGARARQQGSNKAVAPVAESAVDEDQLKLPMLQAEPGQRQEHRQQLDPGSAGRQSGVGRGLFAPLAATAQMVTSLAQHTQM